MNHFPVRPQGWPFLALTALAALAFALLGSALLTVLCLVLAALIGHLFRDPVRIQPDDAELCVAPADGRVTAVQSAPDPFSGEPRQMVRVDIGVLDAKVLRFPVSGKLERLQPASVDPVSGSLFPMPAFEAEIVGKANQRFALRASAAPLLRCLECTAEKGDKLKRADRLGFAAGYVELYLPDGFEAQVMAGEKVLAGQSVLAARKG